MISKISLILLACLLTNIVKAQTKIENFIIVTTDGLRWQEVFQGMDTALANSKRFNENDSSFIYSNYFAANPKESRKKIFPFIWDELAKNGQLYGNRTYGSKVNNANPYWYSYPGYSEFLTGYVDVNVSSNNFPANPNSNFLGFLNKQPAFKGKVTAFGAWETFNRILNEETLGFPVIAAFDKRGGSNPTENEKLLNNMLNDSYKPWNNNECLDVFTHYSALEQLKVRRPKVLYVAYGETDEWAHSGKYKSYLNAAHQVDAWLKELWTFVQSDKQYKDKTALLITVDHGRGEGAQWTSHGGKVPNSNQTWFALIGPGIKAKGEIRDNVQLYQSQLAATITALLGVTFKAEHAVEKVIEL